MEESLVPSLSSGVVGSRFVTQDEIESAKARKEEQWKAAYARFELFCTPFVPPLKSIPFFLLPDSVRNLHHLSKKILMMVVLLRK